MLGLLEVGFLMVATLERVFDSSGEPYLGLEGACGYAPWGAGFEFALASGLDQACREPSIHRTLGAG
jgi:hypothetical protein